MKAAVYVLTLVLTSGAAFAAPAPDSKRLALAKDYIADEQWGRAIEQLRVVSGDPKDPNRDEALFWLAHSQYQVGDHVEAIGTIAQLEQLFPKSRWVRPAHSLRVEIAQRLRRDDVLWVLADPAAPRPLMRAPMPLPPPAPSAVTPAPRGGPPARPMDPPATPPGMAPAPPPPAPAPVAMTPGATTLPPGRAMRPPRLPAPADRDPAQPMPFEGLLPPQPFPVDSDLRMQALVSLIDTHSDRVIPLLREIALNDKDPNEARRAVFVLAQSSRKDARTTVVDAARTGPEVVRIAAIREMGRFQEPVFTNALVGIARSDADAAVRDTAIVSLGRTGARLQLRGLYTQLPPGARFAVLSGLFNAKDDDELIRIASTETDQRLRTRARQHLRLLATPKAVKFLTENP